MPDPYRIRLDFVGDFTSVEEVGSTADAIIRSIASDDAVDVMFESTMIENLESEEE